MRKSRGGHYPDNWDEIARQVKDAAGWTCIRCGHVHAPDEGYTLTVHHLDMNPANCAWWNLLAVCQKCHLHIQARVVLEQVWMFDHSQWFKPYVAGYYAHLMHLPESRDAVAGQEDRLIRLAQTPVLVPPVEQA